MQLRLPLTLMIAVLLAAIAPAEDVSPHTSLGIWSWRQDAITTRTARTRLLALCEKEGIRHVDQHLSIRRVDGVLQIENANKIAMLIKDAAQVNVSISALRGDRNMFFAKNHEARLAEIDLLIEFNERLPKNASLRGLKYDVEPYLTEQWKSGGEPRNEIMRDYLRCLDKMRKRLKRSSASLTLSVDVPFWWDKSELDLEFDGVRKPFVHHIQDRVDSITIMSYRRSSEDVFRLSEQELAYSRSKNQNQSVALGLNFNTASGNEEVTTFAGYPPSDFRKTLSSLREKVTGKEQVQCIMLHDYQSFSKYVNGAQADTKLIEKNE